MQRSCYLSQCDFDGQCSRSRGWFLVVFFRGPCIHEHMALGVYFWAVAWMVLDFVLWVQGYWIHGRRH